MIVNSLHNQEYKTGYKKAYSDLSNAILKSVALGEFPDRTNKFDQNATMLEWEIIKDAFRVQKECTNSATFHQCWVDADHIINYNYPHAANSLAFIDSSGRSWVLFYTSENIYLVDTNGDKGPNSFGKDRWVFTLADSNGKRICGSGVLESDAYCDFIMPSKVVPYFNEDIKTKILYKCNKPPCYYKSWLL